MSRDVTLLHPKLRAIIPRFLADCTAAGLSVLITGTFRTAAEQNKLYAQGRTAAGKIVTNAKYPRSLHNWGVAFDFCRNVKGREYDDSDGFFSRVGTIGKRYGLSWGGDWKNFPDKPHLELTEFSPVQTLIDLYGTPENFIKTWEEPMKTIEAKVYENARELPSYLQPTVLKLMSAEIIKGDGNPDLMLRSLNHTEGELRLLTYLDRAGLFDNLK